MIFSHAYLISGILPVRIAFPCISAIFLKDTVPDSLLVESYIASLCDYDLNVVQRALTMTDYPPDLADDLIRFFSSHGCKQIPHPGNIKQLLCQTAQYTLLVKPAAALNMLHQGVPEEHVPFWRAISVKQLYALYNAMTISTSKVLSLLDEPSFCNAAEEEVWLFLRRFIGNMSVKELRSFLRFVSGSMVICVQKILVIFNTTKGAGRCPVSHTCTSTLELSTSYSTLPEFEKEFRSVLTHPDFSWSMDFV